LEAAPELPHAAAQNHQQRPHLDNPFRVRQTRRVPDATTLLEQCHPQIDSEDPRPVGDSAPRLGRSHQKNHRRVFASTIAADRNRRPEL
jgi:hypothetical protein